MKGYGQFCPVAKGAEIFAERWTPLVLRELMCGCYRFNQIKSGVPLMSPTMLSHRLKTLVGAGIVERRKAMDGKTNEYFLTEAGEELRPIVEGLGAWGHRWVQHEIAEGDLDPGLLMWDMRRRIIPTTPPDNKVVICFTYTDVPSAKSQYWLVLEKEEVDLCVTPPGYEVDLELTTTIGLMARIWLGHAEFRDFAGRPALHLEGREDLVRSFPDWLQLSVFASVERPETR